MKIYINNQNIDYSPVPEETWSALLKHLLDNFIEKNHGIIRIQLDGNDNPDFFAEKGEVAVGAEIKTLEIFTKNSLEICQSGFAKAAAVTKGISAELIPCADLYRKGEIAEGSKKLMELMEALRSIIDFLTHVGVNFAIDYDAINFNNEHTLAGKIKHFAKTVQELVEAQEKQDYVEIADYLEYQLTEDIQSWTEILEKLIDEINKIASSH